MQDSIFTKIINGEIPSHKIYEDDDVFAFLDIHPIVPGHTLVIPKKQVEFAWDLDDETYAKWTLAAKKIALRLREELGTKRVGEKIVGVGVAHAHIHLIPFDDEAEYNRSADEAADPDHEKLALMAERLRF